MTQDDRHFMQRLGTWAVVIGAFFTGAVISGGTISPGMVVGACIALILTLTFGDGTP